MSDSPRPNPFALTPLLLFVAIFLGAGVWFSFQGHSMAFYQVRAPVAILPALALGALIARRHGVRAGPVLLEGMGHPNVQLMCLVFLLAGAFAQVTRASGAVEAVVSLTVASLPASLILPSLFLSAALASLAIGTSMGTIAAIVPIAVGLADATNLDKVLVVGAVVGGAMFGDNLSVISDSTIAATRTQGADMRDKFRENLRVALPAALATVVTLAALSATSGTVTRVTELGVPGAAFWPAVPYVGVLVLALLGLDVVLVLSLGLISAVVIATTSGGFGVADAAREVWIGFEGMMEVLLLSLLVGGLGALMNAAGGLAWASDRILHLARNRTGPRVGEAAVSGLAAVADLLTANNTVAILISGEVVHRIAQEHGLSPRRAASLVDISTSVVQGILPFGAQLLLAGALSQVTPTRLVTAVHYCGFLAVVAVLTVVFRRRSTATQ